MVRKGFSALPILLLVLTVHVYNAFGAPVKQNVPPQAKSAEVPSHITKGDVLILKEKLKELEADLDQLEPVVPAQTTADDEEDEVDIEPVDETDEDEAEIESPVETVQDENPASVEQKPSETLPAQEDSPIVEEPANDNEEEVVGEEDGEKTDGEWGNGVAVNEGIVLYPDSDDLYLRKLIVQALTVLYRKDADRIDRMLQQYENQLLGDDVFEENIAPEPQDLKLNSGYGGQKMEAGAFAERPFTNEELHQEEVLHAMAAKKKQDMNAAEQTLLSDMQKFEGEGITVDELLNDLEDKKKNNGQVLLIEPRKGETDEEEEALFGEYKKDDEDANDGGNEAPVVDEDPAISLQQLQNIGDEGLGDVGLEVNSNKGEGEEDADALLKELMSNLNSSLKNFQEHKGASPK